MKKNIILFGTGKMFRLFMKTCNLQKINIVALCDNNISLVGTCIEGYEVISPRQITDFEYDAVVVVSSYYAQIREQLLLLGIEDSRIWDFSHVAKNVDLNMDENVLLLLKDDMAITISLAGGGIRRYHSMRLSFYRKRILY